MQINISGLFDIAVFYVFLSYGVLKTIEATSYLRVGVLPKASSRLTTVEGDIPSPKRKPFAPPAAIVVPPRCCEVSCLTYATSPGWTQRAGVQSPPHRRLGC
jgi:hypothetical protein